MHQLALRIQELIDHFDMWPSYDLWNRLVPNAQVAGKVLEDNTVLEVFIAENSSDLVYRITLPSGVRTNGVATIHSITVALESQGAITHV